MLYTIESTKERLYACQSYISSQSTIQKRPLYNDYTKNKDVQMDRSNVSFYQEWPNNKMMLFIDRNFLRTTEFISPS